MRRGVLRLAAPDEVTHAEPSRVEPTDERGDKLADAVTHPSKPYVEMSFGRCSNRERLLPRSPRGSFDV